MLRRLFLFDRILAPLSYYWQALINLYKYFWDIDRAGTAVQYDRLKQCNSCPFLTYSFALRRCSLCGCFLVPKTGIDSQKCPDDRWTI